MAMERVNGGACGGRGGTQRRALCLPRAWDRRRPWTGGLEVSAAVHASERSDDGARDGIAYGKGTGTSLLRDSSLR